ncbi:MAG: CHRD domain-containing protein, partial [Gemmatimonadaceae bacterium]
MRKTNVAAAVMLALLSGGMMACDDDDTGLDDDEDFEASLTGAAENPDVTTPATGVASLVLEDRVLTVTVTVSGQLTSDVTMAHIHGP